MVSVPTDVATVSPVSSAQVRLIERWTERRQRGIAGRLVKEIITWSRNERIDQLLLHASDDDRSVYERLGFIAGNEMRFIGHLLDATD